jgi:hypothetical protein
LKNGAKYTLTIDREQGEGDVLVRVAGAPMKALFAVEAKQDDLRNGLIITLCVIG